MSGRANQVDSLELSKPKRNIARDFSDGLLIAEIVHQHHPHLVEVHNYYNTTKVSIKRDYWAEFFLTKLQEALRTRDVPKPKLKNTAYNFNNNIRGDSPV